MLVKGAQGVPLAEVEAAIEQAVAEFPNVQVQDQAAFREQQAGFIDQLLALVTALLLMSILIAVFGIVNTLGLSIYERTRELGLLRAVGMSRRQVTRMMRWESIIIAVFGAVLGVAIGIAFGWALQQALKSEGVSEFVVPVGQLVVYLVRRGADRRGRGDLAGAARGEAQRARGDLVRVAAGAVAIMPACRP